MITTETYPIFEANQVLSYKHLNDLRAFLDQQERHTRNRLIGMGVVCGLEVRRTAGPAIRVGPGAALTSAGYLGVIETERAFARYSEYEDPAGYAHFLDDGQNPLPLWELHEDADAPEADTLASAGAAFLNDRAVVLYVEKLEEDLDSCLADHCINQGRQECLTWRVLLVLKSDLRRLIQRERSLAGMLSEIALQAKLNRSYRLPRITVERPLFLPKQAVSYSQVARQFELAARAAQNVLAVAFAQGFEAYAPLVGSPTGGVNPLQDFSARFTDSLKQIRANKYLGIQHLWDHTRFLAEAYNEFIDAAFALTGECCPEEDRFPCHVMLDAAIPAKACEPSLYRHHFIPSPILAGGKDRLKETQTLFRRLVEMARTFAVPKTKEVRVTPGGDHGRAVGSRAVPYYYEYTSVTGVWHFQDTRRCRLQSALGYTAAEVSKIPEVQQPLRFSLDARDFLRIEGHLGQTRDAVVSALESIRSRFNLPFKIVAVSFGELAASGEECLCSFEDLRSQYTLARAEMLCTMRKILDALARLPGGKTSTKVVNGKSVSVDYAKYMPFTAAESGEASGDKFVSVLKSGGGINKLSVQKGIFSFAYVQLPSEVYSYLPKTNVADFLVQELMGRISKVTELLVADLFTFGLEGFSAEFEAMRSKASDLESTLNELLANPEYKLKGFERRLAVELNCFLLNCVSARLTAIVVTFRARMEKLKDSRTLATFISQHPGVEHKSGVDKGGTFILVYGDAKDIKALPSGEDLDSEKVSELVAIADPEIAPEESVASAVGKKSFSKYDSYNSGDVVMKSLFETTEDPEVRRLVEMALEQGREESPSAVHNLFQDFVSKLQAPAKGKEIVLADFCLPYLCCTDCAQISYVVIPELSFALARGQFCKEDTGRYAFTATPSGGKVTGPGVALENGTYYFLPSAKEVTAGAVTFTYEYAGQAKPLTVEVGEAPEVKFAFTLNLAKGTVQFKSQAPGADKLLWDFGDGQTSAEEHPVHVYDLTKQREFEVKLTGFSTACPAYFVERISFPPETVTFEFDPPAEEFCSALEKLVPFKLDPPDGKVEGPGVVLQGANYGFSPATVPLNDKPVREVKLVYTTPGGTQATLKARVYQTPQPSFVAKIEDAAKRRMRFENTTDDKAGSFKWEWDFGDDSQSQEPSPVHIYKNDENTTYKVVLLVSNGPCSKRTTKTVEIPKVVNPPPNLETNIATLDTLRADPHFDTIIKNESTPLYRATRDLTVKLAEAAGSPDALKPYLTGAKDAELARSADATFTEVNTAIREGANTLKKAEINYLWSYNLLQATNLVGVLKAREGDIETDSNLAKTLDKFAERTKELKTSQGLDYLKPDAALKSALSDPAAFEDKPVLKKKIEALRKSLG